MNITRSPAFRDHHVAGRATTYLKGNCAITTLTMPMSGLLSGPEWASLEGVKHQLAVLLAARIGPVAAVAVQQFAVRRYDVATLHRAWAYQRLPLHEHEPIARGKRSQLLVDCHVDS